MIHHSFLYYQTQDKARLRYTYEPSKTPLSQCQGTVLIFQGRASFIEKFSPVILTLAQQGYHVWAFDWRGQGLSTRLIKDPHKGYIDSYDTYLRDFHHLFTDVIAQQAQGPLIILGQSMGCHIALRYMAQYPNHIDLAVLTAPMLELNTGGYTDALARLFVKTMCSVGLQESYVIGHSNYNPSKEPFEGNMLTHDRVSFAAHRELQKANPKLLVGGVTYGWVKATFDSIDLLNTPETLGKISSPVLLLTAGEEVVVENKNIPRLASWLPQATLKDYKGARHQILSESDLYMKQFWQDFDAFVHQHKPPAPVFSLSKRRLVKASQLAGMKRVYPTLPNDFNRLEPNF